MRLALRADLAAALGAIKARTIIVPVDNDRYFPPVDGQAARTMSGNWTAH